MLGTREPADVSTLISRAGTAGALRRTAGRTRQDAGELFGKCRFAVPFGMLTCPPQPPAGAPESPAPAEAPRVPA
eukprot:1091844-Pyramimonas_sp.AAC.1